MSIHAIFFQAMMAAPLFFAITILISSVIAFGILVFINWFRKKSKLSPWGCLPNLILFVSIVILLFIVTWYDLIFGQGGNYT